MLQRLQNLLLLFILFIPFYYSYANTLATSEIPDEPMEELEEIKWFVKHPPHGVIFTIREYEEDSMSWVAIRLNYYIYLLRNAHPKLPIAILAHGDEVASLSSKHKKQYKKLHQFIQSWDKQGIITHVCGSMAHMLGLDESNFPDYIDVVPYGPSQVKDYIELEHKHIELELTW